MTGQAPENRLRTLLTQEAARLIVDEGVQDYGAAKRKAARHLGGGASRTRDLPTNREVADEVAARMRLYRATPDAAAHLAALRRAALMAMDLLSDFRPRLVGSVLSGLATEHSDINLHLFAETPEDVEIFLHDRGVAFDTGFRRHEVGARSEAYPALDLEVAGFPLSLTVFPPEGIREAPRSAVTGRPEPRAKRAKVAALLAEDSGAADESTGESA
jgi:predicted nucleotidyltransferase